MNIMRSILISFFVFVIPIAVTGISDELIDCLQEKGVIIYGTPTCPACMRLVEDFGGYDIIDPIFIDCTSPEGRDRCAREMKTGFVPEIQIDGNLYEDSRDPEEIAREVECYEDEDIKKEVRNFIEKVREFIRRIKALFS